MKKILIFTVGALIELIASSYGVSKYFWYSVVIIITSMLIYKHTKETKLVRFIRMKKELLDLWVDHVLWSPQFSALLFVITSLFALVDENNKHMLPFLDDIQTWWMKTLMVLSAIVWVPNILFLCVSIVSYDEPKEEELYNEKRKNIINRYTNKTT